MANSRLASRASFFAEVDVLSAQEVMPQRLWGQNLSEAGIFLQTTKPFHPGDRISLRFDVADNEVHVRAAEVVWVKPFEPINVDGTLPGIGVRFLSVDPPARAAIRRYVHTAEATQPRDDVPAPPSELPGSGAFASLELESLELESLKPLSLPPFDSIAPTGALLEARDEPRGEPSLSFDDDGPSIHDALTLPPDDAALVPSTPPVLHDGGHPFAGWRFEVVREAHEERVPPPDGAARPAPKAVSLPPDPGPTLDESGDLHDTLPPTAFSLPPFELSGPATPPEKLNLSFADSLEPEVRGPDVLALAAHQKVDRDFFDGKLSVLELPQAEERGLDAARTRRLRVAWAAGLLLAGGALGVAVGYQPAPEVAAAERVSETRVALLPAPKPVAEAERGLEASSPAAPPRAVKAEKPAADEGATTAEPATVAAAATTGTTETTTTKASESVASSAPSVPFVSPDVIATSEPGKLPRKEDVSLTSAAAPTPRAEPATSVSSVRVEYGRITLPLEGGRVARSFGLAGPPRVVVDLVDAKMPRERSQEIGEKGVARVRFGRPDPVHVRVVVELASGELPKGITTLKKGSSLSVAWR